MARATARADEISTAEFQAGGAALLDRLRHYQPRVLAVLGVTAYRQAFEERSARTGPQPRRLAGTPVWVLPNPSGLNAHWNLERIAAEMRRLAGWAAEPRPPGERPY